MAWATAGLSSLGGAKSSVVIDQLHLTILDNFVGEVLPDVDVLVTFPSPNNIVSNLLPHSMRAVLYRGRLLLRETKTMQKRPEIQDLAASHQC